MFQMKKRVNTTDSEQIIRLSNEDARLIIKLLENPPEPSPRLKQAFENYRKTVRNRDSETGQMAKGTMKLIKVYKGTQGWVADFDCITGARGKGRTQREAIANVKRRMISVIRRAGWERAWRDES